MRSTGIRLFVVFLCCSWFLITGLLNPVIAAKDKEKTASQPAVVEGQIQWEGQKECPPKAEKEECPTTFGPIITDTAIPTREGSVRHPTHLWLELYHQQLQPELAAYFRGRRFSVLWHELEVYLRFMG